MSIEQVNVPRVWLERLMPTLRLHTDAAMIQTAEWVLSQPTPSATPPRIADMAPGTRYTAEVQAPPWSSLPTERRILMRVDTLGRYPNHLSRDQFGSEIANDRIDPSTIRDVTPPA